VKSFSLSISDIDLCRECLETGDRNVLEQEDRVRLHVQPDIFLELFGEPRPKLEKQEAKLKCKNGTWSSYILDG